MKRFLPLIVLVLSVLWVAASFIPAKSPQGKADLVTFGKIPVLVGGRVKPMDTVARNSLLIIHSKSTLEVADGKTLSAIEWLAVASARQPGSSATSLAVTASHTFTITSSSSSSCRRRSRSPLAASALIPP